MSLIKILPENLVNQIAAGEVVERPASVVKELVENSLDAGATEIAVEVKDGGRIFIKIFDNGCGMSQEDCELALQRHATSKIALESDLWKINTLGFRGEALASIAAVSKLTLKSRRRQDLAGTQIDADSGNILTRQDVGMSPGTTVEVFDLFFNTPARQKYLKKTSTELGHITHLLQTIALANPQIAFVFRHNGKVIFELLKATDLISRAADIFGNTVADAMLPVFYGGAEFQLEGFVGKPLLSRSTAQNQYLFVNGRPIQNYAVANRVKAAYHSMLMENKKPVYLLYLKIDPALIDVNVHPRKIEIRFEDQESVLRIVYGAVKTALEKANLTPKAFTESRRYMSDSFPSDFVRTGLKMTNEAFVRHPSQAQQAIDFSKAFLNVRETQTLEEIRTAMRSITQVANSYIVAENADGLVLIDQHAAHERVRYEQLTSQFENQKKSMQPLLVPLQLELASREKQILQENMVIFEELGFEIEPFGGETFIVQSVPAFLAGEDMDSVIKGVLDDILNGKNPAKAQGRKEEILTYMSCRSAIKFGQKLSPAEMQALILQMEKLKKPYTCPHGRPTMISLTLDELGKMFGRK